MGRVYGQAIKAGWSHYGSRSGSYTMYPLSTTTISAIYGRSRAGSFLSKGSSYLSGVKESQIGSSSLPANVIGNFGCSSDSKNSGVASGYGKILTV